MAPHSSTLAWRIPGTEEPGGLVHGVALWAAWALWDGYSVVLAQGISCACRQMVESPGSSGLRTKKLGLLNPSLLLHMVLGLLLSMWSLPVISPEEPGPNIVLTCCLCR